MEMRIELAGNKRVTAHFHGYQVMTDQPKDDGGDGSAPSPFDLFLASLGTCAGFFIMSFCQKRQIPTEGIQIVQSSNWDDARHLVTEIVLAIQLPASFPERYRDSLVKAANLCTVKRHLAEAPAFQVVIRPD